MRAHLLLSLGALLMLTSAYVLHSFSWHETGEVEIGSNEELRKEFPVHEGETLFVSVSPIARLQAGEQTNFKAYHLIISDDQGNVPKDAILTKHSGYAFSPRKKTVYTVYLRTLDQSQVLFSYELQKYREWREVLGFAFVAGMLLACACLLVLSRGVVALAFALYGFTLGVWSCSEWPAEGLSLLLNIPGVLLGDAIYGMVTPNTGVAPHYIAPLLLRIPYVYVLSSLLFWTLLGYVLHAIFKRSP